MNKQQIDKALNIYEGQAELELNFCYEGGEKDAVFVAETMAEAYKLLLAFYEASQ